MSGIGRSGSLIEIGVIGIVRFARIGTKRDRYAVDR